MKEETKFFLEKRITELFSAIKELKLKPRPQWDAWDIERFKRFQTEYNAYARIIRIENGEQIPYGYEKDKKPTNDPSAGSSNLHAGVPD